jgi:hypothetical protein
MRKLSGALIGLVIALAGTRADALCIYDGKLYAETTAKQEFHDSEWVVRAKVLWAHDDPDGPYTTYGLSVLQSYKGSPPKPLIFFTMRDSGGFYLDNGAAHDIGGEYLLFLQPNVRHDVDPHGITGTASVNYNCGQSKRWREVSSGELEELRRLSNR